MKTSKVHQNKEKCMGCGTCALIAGHLFKIDPTDGKAVLQNAKANKQDILTTDLLECDHESCKLAEQACPVNAIRLEED